MRRLSIFVLVMIMIAAVTGLAMAQTIVVWDREVQTEETCCSVQREDEGGRFQ